MALRLAVSAWLVGLSIIDARERRLPHWSTTVPLVILAAAVLGSGVLSVSKGGIARLAGGGARCPEWYRELVEGPVEGWALVGSPPFDGLRTPLDCLAVALAFLAVVCSDTWLALVPAVGGLGLAALLGTVGGQMVTVTWLASLGLTKVGGIGAADAKVVMILAVLFPDPMLPLCIALGVVVLGGLWLVWKRRTAALASLWLSLHGEGPGTKVPGMPLLAAGTLIYLWGSAIWT